MVKSDVIVRHLSFTRRYSLARSRPGPWEKELDDLGRAFSGAFLFGTPLLFTMEMWEIGAFTPPWKLLLILALAFGANIMLAYFAGFKRESTFFDNLNQAVEALAVGALAAIAVLLVLSRIEWGDPLDSILGKIIVQTMPLSIGASVANALFSRSESGGGENGGEENSGGESESEGSKEKSNPILVTLSTFGKAAGGALFIGFSIAPTDEVRILAAELDYGHELAVIALSLLITYLIVFESGFSRRSGNDTGSEKGLFERPITETVSAYVVSLLVALVALYLFNQVQFGEPIDQVFSKVLVLGMPAAIGSAAGRALI